MSPNTSRGASSAAAGILGASAAAFGVALFWGFTVDDAWITARVAWRLANGLGYRFNAHGGRVDAVTPLGWVFLLVPFAKHSLLNALQAARIGGASAWVLAAAWFGLRLRHASKNPYLALTLLAAAPLGAWAAAGMETGFVMALSTAALGDSMLAALAGGVVAALRPEMIPFCSVLSLRAFAAGHLPLARRLGPLALTLACPVVVAIARVTAFGQTVPLAAIAKPSDLDHGLRYGLGVLLFLGPTWLWVGNGWKGLGRQELVIAASVVVHLAALVVVGGDWMPLWRLAVPAMPAVLWVGACLHSRQRPIVNAAGMVMSLGVVLAVGYKVGLPARHVFNARLELVNRVRPMLAESRQVVALDVGWLGAAFEGDIFDLAGVTDPRVARLAGGHTTKSLQNSWFDAMAPDALVLLTAPFAAVQEPWQDTTFARVVENRIKRMQFWQACSMRGNIELEYTTQAYVIVRCL